MAPPASLGSPVVLARTLQAAREAGMDEARLRNLPEGDRWKERPRVWSRIMRAVRLDGFPIRVAQRYSIGEIGPLGLVARVAPDLRSAFERLIHHQRVMTGAEFVRMRDDVARETTIFEFLPIEGDDVGGRCRREMMIATGVRFAREVSGVPVRPRRVCFRHARPVDVSEHEAFFGCEVRFDAEFDGLEFDRDTLALPLPGADPDLSQLLGEHLRTVAGEPPETASLEERLREAVSQRIGAGTLAMPAIAQDLGMSSRTLRRRLLEHRTSYREILDQVRRHAADEMLSDPDHKLSEIAFVLGFSDASAFHRAYVRWTGRTPAASRRAVTSSRISA